jgi:class II lanthipeptide synthase
MSSEAFLDAAEAIGRDIVADAIWHDGRCSWVGVAADPKDAWQPEYRALDGNLYDGTAGVGLFLAELATLTGDAAARRTSVGAMRHAMSRAPSSARPGFHAGSLGVAWAVAVVAVLLGEDELDEGARVLPAAARPLTDGCSDVVLGSAGSAVARLLLAEMFEDPGLLDEAVTTGEQVLERATVGPHGWSWAAPGPRTRHHLCGLSHGAGGIGWALIELFASTGDDRFLGGAEGAFAYERSWMHEASGTWPDLRIGGQRRGGRRFPSPVRATWCHGEAGIALTRLRAIGVLGPGSYGEEARIALDTTERHLVAAMPYDIDDLTLSHGLSGAADVLLSDGRFDAPRELGHVAIERYRSTGWPCGSGGGTTPALFRGTSGIGWWFLRLHAPTRPSPLTLPMRLTEAPAPA